ncbi:MAG: hypothetical protein P1U61_00595 [Legionellaceae bacterium]|nr:hypothetical protein [Legionellaceae bacterium]
MKNEFDSKLNLYLRSERVMLDIFVRDKLRQLFWVSMGLVALLTALIMLDIALFFTLSPYFSIKVTAFILTGFHVFLCLLFILRSKRSKHRKEVEALRDIRDFAKDEVTKDLKVAKDEVLEVGHSVGEAVHQASSVFNGEILNLAHLLPIIRHFLKGRQSGQ